MTQERIGVMGGSFNPIHEGHIALARAAFEQFHLDRVIFIPTGNPPHKRAGLAPAMDRLRMTAAAVAGTKYFVPSRIEIDRSGIIYSVDTFTLLHKQYPGAAFYFLIGEDSLREIPTWHEPDRLFQLCGFLAAPRETEGGRETTASIRKALTKRGAVIEDIRLTPLPYSSTAIRRALAMGTSPYGVCPQVEMYIRLKGLYSAPPLLSGAGPVLDRLYEDLSPKRFRHTLGVAYSAWKLAALNGLDQDRALLAALLHDCAKCLPLKDMQSLVREAGLPVEADVLASGALLHSLAGAVLAKRAYGAADPQVLSAIACHTTGKPGMTDFDMAVYLADKIEPGREEYPLLTQVRSKAGESLLKAALLSLEGTERYVAEGGKAVYPQTLETIKWLKSVLSIK